MPQDTKHKKGRDDKIKVTPPTLSSIVQENEESICAM